MKAFNLVCASRELDAPRDLEHFTREWLEGQRESIDDYLYSLKNNLRGNEIEFQRRRYNAALKEAELALMVVEEWRARQTEKLPDAEELRRAEEEVMQTDLYPKRCQEELIRKYGFLEVSQF